MRALILICVTAAALWAAPAAFVPQARAAATCQDGEGNAIPCGITDSGAPDWALSPVQLVGADRSSVTYADRSTVIIALCTLGILAALLAAMPEFDGRRDRDWESPGEDERG